MIITTTDNLVRYYDPTQTNYGGNGAPVAVLYDFSLSGAHIVASGTAPVVQKAAINGFDAVLFDGAGGLFRSLAPVKFRCGFAVLKINEPLFSNYSGIITGTGRAMENIVLVGNSGTANFYDGLNPLFEIRANDRIYPIANAPAPVNNYRIIFFRSWSPRQLDGLQLGSDRDFPNRTAKMNLALLALYDRDFCESEIRAQTQLLAVRFGLILPEVFPFQADPDVSFRNGRAANLDFPESGGMIAEILGGKTQTADLKFTARTNSEMLAAETFLDNHYAANGFIYRSYATLPPRDSFGYATGLLEHSGDPARHSKNYGFSFRGDR